MKVHCLFEQSGTFKSEFKKLGYEAYDYDYENQFNETDYQLDLFNEIEKAYINEPSIFDNMKENDLIMSFFPCTYFSVQNELIWSRKAYNFRNWGGEKVNKYIKDRKEQREKMFQLLLKFINIVEARNIKTIIENPYNSNYLLTRKEMPKPNLIIMDRRLYGDYYKKPTMFYFINFEPTYFSDYIQQNNEKRLVVSEQRGIMRSLMHKDFANNFIRKYILGN